MSALGGVYAALKTLIAATPAVTSLLATAPVALGGGAAIYDDGAAPQPTQAQPLSTLTPWLTVGAGTEVPFSTFRSRGWNCTVQVKLTGQISEAAGQTILAALSALLLPSDPRYLTVAGFPSSWVDEANQQTPLVETIGGVLTRSWPVIVRVYAT